MDTSSILSKIRKIRDEDSWTSHVKDYMSNLHNYEVYYDDVMRKIAIEAELRPCCLDSDSDLNEDAYYMVSTAGVFPGDRAVQIIHKDLGGNGCTFNAVPWNAKVDLSAWENSKEMIYNHLKRPNTTARMFYAFEYDYKTEDDFSRPSTVLYHFLLYDKDTRLVGNTIEGIINNPLPSKE